MGQYYKVANLDKKEILHPHKFGDGLKLLEFGDSSGGTMTALAVLLSVGNGRGGGDLRSSNPIIGSWAGDRIAIIGDYVDEEEFEATYEQVSEWTDISEQVMVAMKDDKYLAEGLQERIRHN